MTNKDNIFRLLEQDGPFVTEETTPKLINFSPFSRVMAARLKQSRLSTRYRMVRDQIFELLNIKSFAEIQRLINDEHCRNTSSKRAYSLLGNMFGIEGGERECLAAINNNSQTADGVIRYLKTFVLTPYAPYFEMANKVETLKCPVELLLIPFDERYHQKARFEAKRKLVLMSLAATIEQRERETRIEQKFSRFLDFLNSHVWSQEAKIGEREAALLLSQHSPDDFSCREVDVLSWEQIASSPDLPCEPGQKQTLVKRLWFYSDSKKIPIYVTVRKKEPVAKVLKLLRKSEENPDVAVDDELGLMGVLDGIADVRIFQKHLVESASRAGSFLSLEDISDTLEGGTRSGSVGSSAKTPMLKFFARMDGMRVEIILHTNASFINYIYQRGVAHNEYEVRRLFDTGVAKLLFPRDIYLLDITTKKDELLRLFRQQIEAV